MVFPYPFTEKGASALFLFNQRQRQGLRRVNKASAARQPGHRRLLFVETLILSFLNFEIINQTIG